MLILTNLLIILTTILDGLRYVSRESPHRRDGQRIPKEEEASITREKKAGRDREEDGNFSSCIATFQN